MESLEEAKGARIKTHDIHKRHCEWAKERGFRTLSQQAFVGELRTRYEVKRHSKDGNTISGFTLKGEATEQAVSEPVKQTVKKPAEKSAKKS